jgi:hypothetical protein
MPKAGKRHSYLIKVFKEREADKKSLHRMWLSVNGNTASEKIVGYNKNREPGNYGKILYKKRGKWEYLMGKFEKRQ